MGNGQVEGLLPFSVMPCLDTPPPPRLDPPTPGPLEVSQPSSLLSHLPLPYSCQVRQGL